MTRLDRALPQADFLIVAAPLTPETRGLIDRRRLDLLKPGAGIVNIGRAALVDYDGAAREARNGRALRRRARRVRRGAAAARFAVVDDAQRHRHAARLVRHPGYIDPLFDRWFENFERFLAGKPLTNVVDRRLGY